MMRVLKNLSRTAMVLLCGVAIAGCGVAPEATLQAVRPTPEASSPVATPASESPDRVLEIGSDAFRVLDSEGVELQLVPYSSQLEDGIAALAQLFGQEPEIFDYEGDGYCFDAGRAYIWDDLRLVPGDTLADGLPDSDPGQFGIYAHGPLFTAATGAVVTFVGTTGVAVGMDQEVARSGLSPAQLNLPSEMNSGTMLYEYGTHSPRNGVSDDPSIPQPYGAVATVVEGIVVSLHAPGELQFIDHC